MDSTRIKVPFVYQKYGFRCVGAFLFLLTFTCYAWGSSSTSELQDTKLPITSSGGLTRSIDSCVETLIADLEKTSVHSSVKNPYITEVPDMSMSSSGASLGGFSSSSITDPDPAEGQDYREYVMFGPNGQEWALMKYKDSFGVAVGGLLIPTEDFSISAAVELGLISKQKNLPRYITYLKNSVSSSFYSIEIREKYMSFLERWYGEILNNPFQIFIKSDTPTRVIRL